MATTITVGGTEITYRDFSITVPTSPVDIAPSASVTTEATESITANETLTITIDNTTVFEGKTRSGGTKTRLGGVDLEAAHAARDMFEETVSISLTTPTVENVLQAALNDADSGAAFTLDYAGATIILDNDYNVENRTVKRVFRDMMDRTAQLWWVDPAGSTIHVNTRGGGGLWRSIDTQADKATLRRFDEGNVDTVRNDVTVIGTGEEQVTGSATDSNSISEYGRRTGNSPYNVSYVTTQSEADALAQELLVTDPLPEGKLLVGSNVGDVTQPLANQTIDLTDPGKNVDESGLVIESQTIEQNRATLTVGAGSGVSIEEVNRSAKSDDDLTEPGSVYGNDRLGDDSVDTNQLVDAAVIEQKLEDAAVATAKLENNAVINGKLDDLSVSETKIQDDSISTPKLVAEAVTANEIEADTITAAQIAAGTITALEIQADTLTAAEIAAGTITALEIAADTLTANEIDVLDLDAGELSVVDPNTNEGIQFDVSSFNGQTFLTIEPTLDEIGNLGSDTNKFAGAHIDEVEVNTLLESFAIVCEDNVRPAADNTGSVGLSTDAWADMYAYDYIDAGTGSPINDGGDPLAGLAEGRGPPDHAARTDDDGNAVGYSLSAMARSAWEVIRAQERYIEDLEGRMADLEERLSTLEAQQ